MTKCNNSPWQYELDPKVRYNTACEGPDWGSCTQSGSQQVDTESQLCAKHYVRCSQKLWRWSSGDNALCPLLQGGHSDSRQNQSPWMVSPLSKSLGRQWPLSTGCVNSNKMNNYIFPTTAHCWGLRGRSTNRAATKEAYEGNWTEAEQV